MPTLAFGLNASKPSNGHVKAPPKRKAVFDDGDDEDGSPQPTSQSGAKMPSRPLKPLQPLNVDDDSDSDSARPTKSPKLSHPGPNYGLQKKDDTVKYTNLSALRSAKLHDEQASKVDASVYDYDAAYDTFRSATAKSGKSNEPSGPKYMGSLLASTSQRKRDHERAREKAIQREREAEGDEYAGKEQFVTSGYKKQQEENRIAEEEERKRLEEEEERRKKGMGMMDFNKRMLAREEERMKAIAEAEAQKKQDSDSKASAAEEADEEDADKKAQNLNSHGARIALNEEGEIIDKRQLLTAGLNVAPKKPGTSEMTTASKSTESKSQQSRPSHATDARAAQRERQSRMIERQMEAVAEQQAAEEAKVQREQEEKNKSRISEDAKMGAKERYLARRREKEEEAAKKKAAAGG